MDEDADRVNRRSSAVSSVLEIGGCRRIYSILLIGRKCIGQGVLYFVYLDKK